MQKSTINLTKAVNTIGHGRINVTIVSLIHEIKSIVKEFNAIGNTKELDSILITLYREAIRQLTGLVHVMIA